MSSPVKGVKSAGKGMSLGTKGGVIVGVKSGGSQADDDEGDGLCVRRS